MSAYNRFLMPRALRINRNILPIRNTRNIRSSDGCTGSLIVFWSSWSPITPACKLYACSRLYGFRGWGEVPGATGRVLIDIGESKISRFFILENFQKLLKNQLKNYNFLKIFKEILRFFEIFLQFSRNLHENLGKNLENFGNMDLNGVEASENIKKIR